MCVARMQDVASRLNILRAQTRKFCLAEDVNLVEVGSLLAHKFVDNGPVELLIFKGTPLPPLALVSVCMGLNDNSTLTVCAQM